MSNIHHIKDLIPDPRNARAHTPRNVGMIEAALGEVGAARSIVIDEDGVVLAGNATIEAAAQAGIERVQVVDADGNTIIAVRRSGLTPEQKTRLALFDNRAAELADWDAGVLAALAEETDLSQLFRDEELAALLAQEAVDIGGAGDEFDTTPEDGPTRTQTGDLFALGDHRLLCGDSTKPEHVQFLMNDTRADTLISDPPYGVGYEYDEHDDSSNSNNLVLVMSAFELGPPARIWTPGLMNLARDLTWNEGAKILCWHKKFAAAGNGLGGASTWEPVLVVGVRGGTLPNDYLEFMTDRIPGLRDDHPCPKPIGLYEHLIECLAGKVIYEPFCGSGTTLIAANRKRRQCYAMELSPRYCDVILRRWEAETGRGATLERRLSD